MPLFKKISGERKIGKNITDKVADIFKRHKGSQSKLYNHSIRRFKKKKKHPNLSTRIQTIFQYDGSYNKNRLQQILVDENINNKSILARLRNIGKCNIPIALKKPTHEMTLGAMRSECHIVKFKSHPTGVYRNCLRCGDEMNNTIHVLYHCPFAKVILNYFTIMIRIVTGIDFKINILHSNYKYPS